MSTKQFHYFFKLIDSRSFVIWTNDLTMKFVAYFIMKFDCWLVVADIISSLKPINLFHKLNPSRRDMRNENLFTNRIFPLFSIHLEGCWRWCRSNEWWCISKPMMFFFFLLTKRRNGEQLSEEERERERGVLTWLPKAGISNECTRLTPGLRNYSPVSGTAVGTILSRAAALDTHTH